MVLNKDNKNKGSNAYLDIACPVCGSKKNKLYLTRNDKKRVYQCVKCTLYISEEILEKIHDDYEKE